MTRIDRAAITFRIPGTTRSEMTTSNITQALRNALVSLIGYPPVMHDLLTRRLAG